MANKSVWKILFEGFKIYSLNMHKFFLYMAFPVLGQISGIFLIFGLSYWYTQNINALTIKYPVLNDVSAMIAFAILLIIPGLLLFTKAFWDYLVAYVAINSMTEGYLNTGKVYDFKAHNDIVYQKTFSFVLLWTLFGIFSLLSSLPVFWILGIIFFVYFVLIFQVFTFENGLSPVGYFKRSFAVIKGNFVRTFLLMGVLALLTYWLLVSGVSVIFDVLNFTKPLTKIFETWVYTLPLDYLYKFGITPTIIAQQILAQFIFMLVVMFTLPVRSICWTLWYKNLNKEVVTKSKKTNKKTPKKVVKSKTTKLPENFKIEKRGIDPEIIRRARLEDNEY